MATQAPQRHLIEENGAWVEPGKSSKEGVRILRLIDYIQPEINSFWFAIGARFTQVYIAAP